LTNRRGDGIEIVRVDEEPGFPRLDCGPYAAGVAGHDWLARRQRVGERDPESLDPDPFLARQSQVEVRSRVEPRKILVRDRCEPSETVGDAASTSQRLETTKVGSLPDYQIGESRISGLEPSQGFYPAINAFVGNQSSDGKQPGTGGKA